jgi:hypothetical protein
MNDKLIMCSSLTHALKGKRLLDKRGIYSYITKPPKKNCNCGYCIAVNYKNYYEAYNLLISSGIKIIDNWEEML